MDATTNRTMRELVVQDPFARPCNSTPWCSEGTRCPRERLLVLEEFGSGQGCGLHLTQTPYKALVRRAIGTLPHSSAGPAVEASAETGH